MDYHEIVRIIFSYLRIPDQRMCIRTCKSYQNLVVDEMNDEMKRMLKYSWTEIKYLSMAKFTLEFLYYGYHHLVPDHYMIYENRVLHSDYCVFERCVKCKYDKTLDFMMHHSFQHCIFYYEVYETIQGAAAQFGRLDTLQWILNVALIYAFQDGVYEQSTWDDILDALIVMSAEQLEPIFKTMLRQHGIPDSEIVDIAHEHRQYVIEKYILDINLFYREKKFIKLLGMII